MIRRQFGRWVCWAKGVLLDGGWSMWVGTCHVGGVFVWLCDFWIWGFEDVLEEWQVDAEEKTRCVSEGI